MPAEQRDPRVDAYIEKAAPFAQPILSHLRELMHRACPRATEEMKWSMPFFVQQGVILANMAAFKQHCAFGFWGPEMQKALAADGLDSSEAMGTLGRITSLKDLPLDKALLAYMRHAGELVESGQRTKSLERPKKAAKKKPVTVPAELAAALKKNKVAAKAFAEFSPSCQREYCEWIVEAKRPETKEKRLKDAMKLIAQGKTRYWKYEKC
ncbi:MAG TPA: YdeI/OmpD-associated family protein [Candidatus Acidoferrum sp.]|nr:YdeI/OmpD-associated family protein [Candidatus Acidoferrum sp.]